MIKRVVLFILILLILSSLNLFADDDLFKTFQLSYVILDYLDICSTLYGIEIGLIEANPLAKLYIKKPFLTFAVHVVLDLAIMKITDRLFNRSKKLAWAFIIGLNLVKGYILYRNIKILGR